MTPEEPAYAVIDALQCAAIPYMLVGSLASNIYGVPRATHDADIVVELSPGDLATLAQALGPAFELDPQTSFETITATMRHILRAVGSPFVVELFRLSDDPHDQERFARRRRVEHAGRQLCLPTPEDVVITKLRWALQGGRQKDRQDALNVIAVQQHRLDWAYVARWCDQHGTRELLDELRALVPPI